MDYKIIKEVIKFVNTILTLLIILLLVVFLHESEVKCNEQAIEITLLQNSNMEICDINNELMAELEEYQSLIENKNNEIADLQKQIKDMKKAGYITTVTNSNNTVTDTNTNSKGNYGSKKTYMYYTSITNKSSAQWKVQTRATTNGYGVRVVQENGREYACIAIGTGWGYSVGTKLYVATTNGGFYAIVGDIKGNSATTPDHLKGRDGSITEFIVDKNLNKSAKNAGNLNVISAYSGEVTNITKV